MLLGEAAVAPLFETLADPTAPLAVRRQIPRALGELGATGASRALASALDDPDPGVRQHSMTALHRIREARPEVKPLSGRRLAREVLRHVVEYEKLTAAAAALDGTSAQCDDPLRWLLDNLNEERLHQLGAAFDFLALEYPVQDVKNAWRALTDGGRRRRSNAVELMDTLLPSPLKGRIVPLLESFDPQRPHLRTTRGAPDREQALRSLVEGNHTWIAACALFAARALCLPGLEDAAARALESTDAVLREEGAAYRAFAGLGGEAC